MGDEFKDDYRQALPKELIQELTRRSAWRATAAILHDVAVLAAAIGAALYFWPNPLVIAVAVIVVGTRQHALFVVAHESAHYLLYGNRRLNDLAGRACATVQGLSMCTYRVIHRLHHNNLYGELDPDTALHGGYPRGRAYLLKKLLKDLSGLTAWKTYAYFLGGAPALNTQTNVALRPLDDTSSRLKSEARSDRNLVIAFHVVALALFAWSGYLVQYFVLWILPLVTVVQAILRLRAIAEHGATTDFSSAVAALGALPAPRQLPRRAPSLCLGAAAQPAGAARGDGEARAAGARGGRSLPHHAGEDFRRARYSGRKGNCTYGPRGVMSGGTYDGAGLPAGPSTRT